ncbi:asparaginase [Gloeobacter morelensis]|uniref:Asparaginase n=1 Tax=Gloeobacter morelensis MG652769 TaxID=2781736 RepID=A0ABY3PKA8_9CYAN|nr:asparaginase [Gloeobacter morelensis]UFP94100.1 asparaginase [Gloeobacter morelensis MG652769]
MLNLYIPSIEVRLLREGLVESVHYCEAVVADHRGRTLAHGGNKQLPTTFIRSALKPFQALPVLRSGAHQAYAMDDADLALLCSSHSGELIHARRAFNLLWRMGLDPAVLVCPVPPGRTSPLEYNCSGKHAGMLAVCRQRSWTTERYADRRHPVQLLIAKTLCELLALPFDELVQARDDCGVPTYQLALAQMAWLYAQLSSGESAELECLARAMIRQPEMVAGEGRFDTVLMQMSGGDLVSKAGAEGVQCIGRMGQGMGLAIKVYDGSDRAKYPVVIHLLRQLGWIDPAVADALGDRFAVLGEHQRLEVVGELEMA